MPSLWEDKFCCGVRHLGDLSNPHENYKNVQAALTDIEGVEKVGLVLATTIDAQGKDTELTKAGFKALLTFHNPNSRNEVTLWGKVVNQDMDRRLACGCCCTECCTCHDDDD